MALSLHYWNGRGLAEVPRMMLAASGKFPGDGYADVRCTSDDLATYGAGADKVTAFDTVKDSLDCNLGRLPMLKVGEACIGQSDGINHYLATELGFMGANNVEGAQVVQIASSIKECATAWRKLVPYGSAPSEETDKTWFDTPAGDVKGVADSANRANRHLRWYAGRMEGVVGDNGFCVSDKLTLADIMMYNAFAETMTDAEAPKADFPKHNREPFGNGAKTAEVLKDCPKISKIIESVKSNAGIAKWLSTRGVQRF